MTFKKASCIFVFVTTITLFGLSCSNKPPGREFILDVYVAVQTGDGDFLRENSVEYRDSFDLDHWRKDTNYTREQIVNLKLSIKEYPPHGDETAVYINCNNSKATVIVNPRTGFRSLARHYYIVNDPNIDIGNAPSITFEDWIGPFYFQKVMGQWKYVSTDAPADDWPDIPEYDSEQQ